MPRGLELAPNPNAPAQFTPEELEKLKALKKRHEDAALAQAGTNALKTNEKLRVSIVGLGQNIRAHAVEAAQADIERRAGVKGFKGIVNKIWYGSIGREMHLNVETHRAEEAIRLNKNLLHHQGLSDTEMRVATALRFADEYDQLIHTEAGEHRTRVFDQTPTGEVDPAGAAVKREIASLIEKYARGDISTEEDFAQERERMIYERLLDNSVTKEFVEKHLGDMRLYADNLLTIAQNVKARELSDAERADLLANMEITLGEARTGVRTEQQLSRVEKITKALDGKVVFNEATISAGVAVALSVGGLVGKSVVGAATKAFAPGVAGGVWAGLREARVLREERTQMARERAAGRSEGMTDRDARIAETLYEARDASQMTNQLLAAVYDERGELRDLQGNDMREALQMIAECKARTHLSDTRKIDLISFSSIEHADKERLKLDLAVAKAEVALNKRLSSATRPELEALGISGANAEDSLQHPDQIYNGMIGSLTLANEGLLQGEMDSRDRLYNKMRNTEVAKAVLKGTVLGGAIGLAFQEAHALFDSNQQGLIEGFRGQDVGASHQTALEGMFHPGQSGHNIEILAAHQTPNMINYSDSVTIGKDGALTLPEGFSIEHHGNTITITEPGGRHLDNIPLTKDGRLTTEGQNILKAAHLNVTEETHFVTHQVTKTEHVSVDKFLKDSGTTKVTRDFWFDNRTPGVYEGGELGLQWPQVDGQGNIRISVAGMDNPSTSSVGAETNWHDLAAKGNLKIALSVSDGTQSRVFMFDVDQNGQAIVPKDSPAAQLFETHNGQVTPHYRYMEVVQTVGVDDKGVEHIRPLATAVGLGETNGFTETVTSNQTDTVTNYTVTPIPEQPAATPHIVTKTVDAPFVVVPPITGDRRKRVDTDLVVADHSPETTFTITEVPEVEEPILLPPARQLSTAPPNPNVPPETHGPKVNAPTPKNPSVPPEAASSLGKKWEAKINQTLAEAAARYSNPNIQPAPAAKPEVAPSPQPLKLEEFRPGSVVRVSFPARDPIFRGFEGFLKVIGDPNKPTPSSILRFIAVNATGDRLSSGEEFSVGDREFQNRIANGDVQRAPELRSSPLVRLANNTILKADNLSGYTGRVALIRSPSGNNYTFKPVDVSGNDLVDEEMVAMSAQEAVEAMNRGALSL